MKKIVAFLVVITLLSSCHLIRPRSEAYRFGCPPQPPIRTVGTYTHRYPIVKSTSAAKWRRIQSRPANRFGRK